MDVKKTEETKGMDCLQVYPQTCLLNNCPGRATLLLYSLCRLALYASGYMAFLLSSSTAPLN